MKMRILPLVATVLACTHASARAEPDGALCDAIAKLVDASAEDFRQFRGERTANGYDGSFLVADAEYCIIHVDNGLPSYVCYGPDMARAETLMRARRMRLKINRCLAEWEQVSDPNLTHPVDAYWNKDGIRINLYAASLDSGEWYWTLTIRYD